MTDVLFRRFDALADPADGADWADVRRRARPRRRYAVLLLATAAAAVAAAALAAGNGWLFTSADRQVTAVTHVSFQGQTWRVSLTSRSRHWLSRLCVRLEHPGARTISHGCGSSSLRVLGPPFGARRVDLAGGQIWVGTTLGAITRISIVDAAGHAHTTQPAAAPRGTKTPFRYWVIALDGTTARTIVATTAAGRSIRKALP
jgi:hypothetical protein